MGVSKSREGIVVDRRDRAATMDKIEGKSFRAERAVRLLCVDGLGQFAVAEGECGIVLAVSGIAGHRDIVEREIVDFLQRAFASRFQADKLHARDVFAGSRILEQGNETRRQSRDVDHQRIELRLAGTAARAAMASLVSSLKVNSSTVK